MAFGFRNISIIGKIAVPATIIAVVSVGIVLFASLSVSNLSDTAAALIDRNATRVQLALQAESSFNSAAVSEKNVILSAADGKAAQANIETYKKATADTLNQIGRLETITSEADQRALIETFRAAVVNRQEASAHVFELALASKVDERPFAYSRGDGRQSIVRSAMEVVGKLIAINDGENARRRVTPASPWRRRRVHSGWWPAPSPVSSALSACSAGSRCFRDIAAARLYDPRDGEAFAKGRPRHPDRGRRSHRRGWRTCAVAAGLQGERDYRRIGSRPHSGRNSFKRRRASATSRVTSRFFDKQVSEALSTR